MEFLRRAACYRDPRPDPGTRSYQSKLISQFIDTPYADRAGMESPAFKPS
jgi:hypothetical protein